MRELITKRVIRCAEGHLVPHEVDEQTRRTNEEDLHEGVVDGDEIEEQVRVPHQEHKQIDLLCLAGETYRKLNITLVSQTTYTCMHAVPLYRHSVEPAHPH